MGVQCTLLGHAFDGTELDERREERSDGTVLICREYQVCERCGRQQELYRNEQLLPNGATDGDTPDPSTEAAAEGDTPASSPGPAEDSAEPVETDGHGEPTATDGVGEADALEPGESDAVILSAPDDDEPDDQESSEREYGEWPGEAGSEREGVEETREERPDHEVADTLTATDDAVILSEPGDETDDCPEVCCPDCGKAWPRTETSLRNGDLCPACREGYVEVQSVESE